MTKIPEQRPWCNSGVFNYSFRQILHLVSVFPLLFWTSKCRLGSLLDLWETCTKISDALQNHMKNILAWNLLKYWNDLFFIIFIFCFRSHSLQSFISVSHSLTSLRSIINDMKFENMKLNMCGLRFESFIVPFKLNWFLDPLQFT